MGLYLVLIYIVLGTIKYVDYLIHIKNLDINTNDNNLELSSYTVEDLIAELEGEVLVAA